MTVIPVFSADTKVEGRIYADWMLNSTRGADNYNTFELGRSYLTAKSKLSDNTSANITVDLRRVDPAYAGYMIVLKNAYGSWKPKFSKDYLAVVFGLQPTKYLEAMNNYCWGRRYLAQAIGDARGFLSTADPGLTFDIDLAEKGNYGYAGLSIWNGTKFTDVVDKNNQKDFNPYIVLKPAPNSPEFGQSLIVGQIYLGTRNVTITGNRNADEFKHMLFSLGGKLAYKSLFDFGIDLNWDTQGQAWGDTADLRQSALSFFGALYFKEMTNDSTSLFRTLDIFGRVDVSDPNTDVNDNGETLVIIGFECVPSKGIAGSLNYRVTSYQDEGTASAKYLYLNMEYRF